MLAAQGGGVPHFHGDMFGDGEEVTCMYGPDDYSGGVESHPPVVGFSYDGHLIYGRCVTCREKSCLSLPEIEWLWLTSLARALRSFPQIHCFVASALDYRPMSLTLLSPHWDESINAGTLARRPPALPRHCSMRVAGTRTPRRAPTSTATPCRTTTTTPR